MSEDAKPVRVGVVGYGSIGRTVAEQLANGGVGSATLSGIGLRAERRGERLDGTSVATTVTDLIDRSDVIVEAAGATALRDHGLDILSSGCSLVVVSTGALLDEDLLASLTAAGSGRLHIAPGAIGGLDLVRAAAAMGPIERAAITTTKKPAGLVQDHMSSDERTAFLTLAAATELFAGPVTELVERFPASTNVAASLALACGSVDVVEGRVRADPAAQLTTHLIEIAGAAGNYRFEITNHPSPTNPRSSGIVPWSVVSLLSDLCRR